MVDVTRVFVHDLDTEKMEKIMNELRSKFTVESTSTSKVVPNFIYIEIKGNVKKEVEKLLSSFNPLDFKVVYVNV